MTGDSLAGDRQVAVVADGSVVGLCRICGGAAEKFFRVREMMFGSRDEFGYFQCADCGCLQISEIPTYIGEYYPVDYYSFHGGSKNTRLLRDWIRKKRAVYAIERKGLVGALLYAIKKPDPLFSIYERIGATPRDSVLDVGGGCGQHTMSLRRIGFEKAFSIDPNIACDIEADGSVIARKAEIFDIDGVFDLITFHHSFEHMENPKGVLAKACRLASMSGRILIRVPTVSSEAWETYGPNWSNLDAPRHLYLHSRDSISRLAEAAGLRILDMWCDSVAFQFWGSEQYAADIPMNDTRSYSQGLAGSIFTERNIKEFEQRACELNRNDRGDLLCGLFGPTQA